MQFLYENTHTYPRRETNALFIIYNENYRLEVVSY